MTKKLWTKSYLLAILVMFGLYMFTHILMSVMSVYAKNLTGLDSYAGLMTSVFTLGALSVRFLAGSLIQRSGCKKVILAGIVLIIVSTALFFPCHNTVLALVARGLQGIGFGLSATATGTYIATLCHPSRMLEGISYVSVSQSLAAVLGPSVGFGIIGASYDRFNGLFVAAMAIASATLILMTFEKESRSPGRSQTEQESSQKIQWKLIVLPVMILFMNSLTQSALVSYLALFAISMDFSGVGMFFTVNAVGMIASRFVMNRLVRRFGNFTVVLINSLIFAASVLLLTQVRNISQMLLIAFPAGFSMGAVAPIVNTYLIQSMPDHKKGLANAIYFSTLDGGYCLGSVGWGLVASTLGYACIFFIASIIQFAAVFVSLIQIRKVRLDPFGCSVPENQT